MQRASSSSSSSTATLLTPASSCNSCRALAVHRSLQCRCLVCLSSRPEGASKALACLMRHKRQCKLRWRNRVARALQASSSSSPSSCSSSSSSSYALHTIPYACLHIHATFTQLLIAAWNSFKAGTGLQPLPVIESPLPSSSSSSSTAFTYDVLAARCAAQAAIIETFERAWLEEADFFTSSPATGDQRRRGGRERGRQTSSRKASIGENREEESRQPLTPSVFPFASSSLSSSVSPSSSSSPFTSLASSISPLSSPLILPTLSVRSALSLYLSYRAYPPSSRVLVSAVTIPDLLSILRFHRLIPVPVDLQGPHSIAVDERHLVRILDEHEACASSSSSSSSSASSSSSTSLPRSASGRIVAIIVAHIWGKQADLTPVIAACHRRGVEVWEDMAECWRGLQPLSRSPQSSSSASVDHNVSFSPLFVSFSPSPSSPDALQHSPYDYSCRLGHPESDVVLFSFGTIKHATCFGGAVFLLHSRHSLHHSALALRHELEFPAQKESVYSIKLAKISLGMLALNSRSWNRAGRWLFGGLGIDYKALVVQLTRGFGGGARDAKRSENMTAEEEKRELQQSVAALMSRLHEAPSTALMIAMAERLVLRRNEMYVERAPDVSSRKSRQESDGEALLDNTLICEMMTHMLLDSESAIDASSLCLSLVIPGLANQSRHYWLYPVLTPLTLPRSLFMQRLNLCGIDAYIGATQLALVESPPELEASPSAACPRAQELMNRVVYLPVHRLVDVASLVRMAALIELVVESPLNPLIVSRL